MGSSHSGTIITFWAMLDLLALVTAFGVGTGLAMIAKRWWFSLGLYLAFSVYLFAKFLTRMTVSEWVLYAVGLIGAVLSAIAVRLLKKNGYPLFS